MSAVDAGVEVPLGRATANRVLESIATANIAVTRDTVSDMVRSDAPLASQPLLDHAVALVRAELTGLGPLQVLWEDNDVTDVLVNGPNDVWVERYGVLAPAHVEISERQIDVIVERVLSPLSLTLDRLHPIAEGRLSGGGRVTVVGPPVSPTGTIVALRRLTVARFDLTTFGHDEVTTTIADLVTEGANIVIFGPTGSGKSTLLATLVDLVPNDERIIVVEDTLEIPVAHPGAVRLESGPAQRTGSIGSGFSDLVRVALRLRPDRLVVGEVRGPEALDLVWALSTGHRGSMATVHAEGPADVLRRLEIFCSSANPSLTPNLIGAQVRAAVEVLIEVRRDTASGRRGICGAWRTADGRSLMPGHREGT